MTTTAPALSSSSTTTTTSHRRKSSGGSGGGHSTTPSAAGSSRRGSSASASAAAKSRFDPTFMMSSNDAGPSSGAMTTAAAAGSNGGAAQASYGGASRRASGASSTGHSRQKSSEDVKVTRGNNASSSSRHKSSDRLHLLGAGHGSSSNLASKRTRSQGHMAAAQGVASASAKRSSSRRRGEAEGARAPRNRERDEDDGWTSTSQPGSPGAASGGESESDGDEGLVMGSKKRAGVSPAPPLERQQKAQAHEQAGDSDFSVPPAEVQEQRLATTHPAQQHGQAAAQPGSSAMTRSSTDQTLRGEASEHLGAVEASAATASGLEAPASRSQQEQQQGPQRGRVSDESAKAHPSHQRVLSESHHSTLSASSDETLAQDPAELAPTSTKVFSSSPLPADPLPPQSGEANAASGSRPWIRVSSHLRSSSAASSHTLNAGKASSHHESTHSPASIRSRPSVRARPSLLAHEAVAAMPAPQISTHNALAGTLGHLHEERETAARYASHSSSPDDMRLAADFANINSVHFGMGGGSSLHAQQGSSGSGHAARRKASVSSLSSNINLPTPSPSVGNINQAAAPRSAMATSASHDGSGRHMTASISGGGIAGMTSSDTTWLSHDAHRRRTTSTNSLTAVDAAKLAAQLRRARDGTDDGSSASGAGSGSGGPSSVGFGGMSGATLGRALGGSSAAIRAAAIEARYNKPIVSSFAKDFTSNSAPLEVAVHPSSVFDENFTRATTAPKSPQAAAAAAGARRKDKGKASSSSSSAPTTSKEKKMRYIMGFGLSGPPVEKTPINDALLAPSFESDEFESSWAPALANAAGLGARSGPWRSHHGQPSSGDMAGGLVDEDGNPISTESLRLGVANMSGLTTASAATASASVPNSTAVHFIHGLTTVSDNLFPLDPADIAYEGGTLGPAAAAQLQAASGLNVGVLGQGAIPGYLYLEPKTMRAIALTSQAMSVHRAHTVTRRFADPMRESLERVARASGQFGLGPKGSTTPIGVPGGVGVGAHGGGLSSSGGSGGHGATSKWGRRTAPSSPVRDSAALHGGGGPGGSGFGANAGGSARGAAYGSRPGFPRSNTGTWSSGGGGGGGRSPGAVQSGFAAMVAEDPMGAGFRGLKRVFSGGLNRGGLAALTRTEEER